MTAAHNHCKECNNDLTGRAKEFCSSPCRMAFNNRRMKRGAEIYDLFRAMRRERDQAKALGIWSEMCRLELRWHQEDEAERPGRKSYVAPATALRNLRETGRLMMGEFVGAQGRKGNWSLSPDA